MRYLLFIFAGLVSIRCFAQQSLFNVPSISVTKKNEVFFQEQINATVGGTSANFNTAYGLGHLFEVGFNIIGMGVGFDKNNPILLSNTSMADNNPQNPIALLTALKAFKLAKNFTIGAGGQVGFNPLNTDLTANDVATFDYVNLRYDFPQAHFMVCGGGYYSNIVYVGYRDQFGGILGFEYAVIKHKFLLMGDWVIGTNAASVMVPGFVYHPHHNIALSLGWQLPSPGSSNPQGIVFELTLGNFSSK